jgi:hypothetical protein
MPSSSTTSGAAAREFAQRAPYRPQERYAAGEYPNQHPSGDGLPNWTKANRKANNIAGLQVADLIAHPSYRACIARRRGQSLAENFGGEIARILEQGKYDRSPSGRIAGWGEIWLP